MNTDNWEILARDRTEWWHTVTKGTKTTEKTRRDVADAAWEH